MKPKPKTTTLFFSMLVVLIAFVLSTLIFRNWVAVKEFAGSLF